MYINWYMYISTHWIQKRDILSYYMTNNWMNYPQIGVSRSISCKQTNCVWMSWIWGELSWNQWKSLNRFTCMQKKNVLIYDCLHSSNSYKFMLRNGLNNSFGIVFTLYLRKNGKAYNKFTVRTRLQIQCSKPILIYIGLEVSVLYWQIDN